MHNVVVYIEIVSIENSDNFLLYIPSKYKFCVQKSKNVFNIKYIETDESQDNTVYDYAGEPNEHNVENEYKEIDLHMSPTVQGNNIGNHLEENYKRSINLKDMSSDDSKEIKDIVRQLKRLRFCVQNVKYKITIMYKNYICSIKRDDSIECFSIKKYNGKPRKTLFVTCDLELMYEKMESLMENIDTIKKGLYHILDKNHFTHSRTLQRLLSEKNTMVELSEKAYMKKIQYEKYIQESNEMLKGINKSEKIILEKIYDINEKYKNPVLKGLQNDIDKSHQISKLNSDITDIYKVKKEVLKTIIELKNKREDTILNVDKIMFDNNVMVECVIRNFKELGLVCGTEKN
jgi:hypothetical protein